MRNKNTPVMGVFFATTHNVDLTKYAPTTPIQVGTWGNSKIMRKHLSGQITITAKNTNAPLDTTINTRVMDVKGILQGGNNSQWMLINSIRFSSANEPFFSSTVFMNANNLWINVFDANFTSGSTQITYDISVDYLA